MTIIAVPLYGGGQREFLNLLFYYLSSKFIFFVIIIFVKGKVILSFFIGIPQCSAQYLVYIVGFSG